jgi:putative ABC transport system substrate-binding protein
MGMRRRRVLQWGLGVASLARPGGNVTGVTGVAPHLSGKRLQILNQMIPGLTRAAALDDKPSQTDLDELQVAANTLDLELHASIVDLSVRRRSG